MKTCHVCATECADDAELCPLCGAELTVAEEAEEAAPAGETVIEHPVLAASVEDVVTAEIFCDVLTENGIGYSCDTAEQDMKVLFGGSFVAADIYVEESDLSRAQELYEEVLNAEPEIDWESDDFEEEPSEDDAE